MSIQFTMSRPTQRTFAACAAGLLLLATMAALLGAKTIRAAEVHLRPSHQCRAPLVLLGDIADVHAADTQRAAALARIELFPAPAAGRVRNVRLREIQDVLALRDVDLADCRFGGASVISIRGPSDTKASKPTSRRVSSATVRQTERMVREAIVGYLQEHDGAEAGWDVSVDLDRDQAQRLATAGPDLKIAGGRKPWEGIQTFTVILGRQSRQRKDVSGRFPFRLADHRRNASATGERIAVRARVARPATAVVAARSLRRGQIVRAADVRLQPVRSDVKSKEFVYRIDDVVGKETTRSVATGQAFDHRYVRPPILVRRSEVVTVRAHAAGVKVTTSARALEEGSKGDLITVESLLNRERYAARVVGIQEVAVYPRRMTITSPREEPRRLIEPVDGPTDGGRTAPGGSQSPPKQGAISGRFGRSAAGSSHR